MIYKRDSIGKHLIKANRHTRLCYQVSGADKFAKAIEPVYEAVEEKNRDYRNAVYTRYHAHDTMTLQNSRLDNAVRTAFEKCKQHDRQNPGKAILERLFPGRVYGHLVNNSMFKESLLVEQVAIRFENLGEEHPLYNEAAILRSFIQEMRSAIVLFNTTEQQEKEALTKRALAMADLRKQYETNYLDARKELGKAIAKHLFPDNPHRKPESEEEVSQVA